jgi:ubiquinone/menaquinone biosynthesis C-methylase UbiE
MNTVLELKNILSNHFRSNKEVDPLEAYELWSEIYDDENGNLMLHFDRILFEDFMKRTNLAGKNILDFGCGTGRYWRILAGKNPNKLIGCDISKSMVNKLKKKFPEAETYVVNNNKIEFINDNSIDFIISTLVVAHFRFIDDIVSEWSRILKKEGEIFITDFHPDALRKGAKRTFKINGKNLTVKNYIHPVEKLEGLFSSAGFHILKRSEKIIDENVKEFYLKKGALDIFEKYKNVPMIYSLHLKR